jgi:hypothetical protein
MFTEGIVEVTRGERGAIIGTLNRYLGDNENRKLVLAWLFSPDQKYISTKTLDNGQWYALKLWIDWWQNPETTEWLPGETFPVEAMLILTEACKQHGLTPPAERDDQLVAPELVEQMAVYLGGVVSNIEDDHGNFVRKEEVRLPDEYQRTKDFFGKPERGAL